MRMREKCGISGVGPPGSRTAYRLCLSQDGVRNYDRR